MDSLKQLFRDAELKHILEQNPEIQLKDEKEVRKILKLLADQKCNHRVMRSVILTNPFVLTRDPDDLSELIYKLKEYHIIHLDKVFEGDPYITSKYAYEVDSFFFVKQKEGLSDEEIIKLLEDEPYLMEMTSFNQYDKI